MCLFGLRVNTMSAVWLAYGSLDVVISGSTNGGCLTVFPAGSADDDFSMLFSAIICGQSYVNGRNVQKAGVAY